MQQFAEMKPVADRRGRLKEYRKPFTAQYGEADYSRSFSRFVQNTPPPTPIESV
jgi:hypothetical protein